ncbi:MAG: hypothetical protein LUG98_03885 [Tannerellaceae bacterium]|nr:hypothetical protein [Tannerellaceae bacterium]
MDTSSKIKDLLRKIAGTDKATYNFRLMEVVSVEGDRCTARLGTFEIPNIRLASIVDGAENGILVTPAEGSIILVADISCGELRNLVAIAYSEIDSIRIHKEDTLIYADDQTIHIETGQSVVKITDGTIEAKAGNSQIEMTDGLIRHNEGTLGGLVQVNELTSQLNDLAKVVNSLIGNYNGHTHGSYGAAPTTAQEAGSASFDPSAYENRKITH